MKKLYLLFTLTLFTLNAGIAFNGSIVHAREIQVKKDTALVKSASKHKSKPSKIEDTRSNKPGFFKAGLRVILTPFRPLIFNKPDREFEHSPIKTDITPHQEDDKVLSNVKVYPNPVEDQLNLSFKVNKDSNVTIKVMDVLGNEITTLLSQKLMAGEQNNSFNIASRLTSGFYFIRLVVGDEVVIKRISVL